MSWEAWISVAAALYVLGMLMFTRIPADIVFLSALTLLLLPLFVDDQGHLHGVLTPTEAIAGMSNTGMATVGVLFIVVAGLKETGGLTSLVQNFLGYPKTAQQAQRRLMLPVAFVSGFMNNTPLVAIMIPVIKDWSEKVRVSASKLMMPLSFAAILGGVCTLIGTSTNLTVLGLMQQQLKDELADGSVYMGMFTVAWVGVPCAIVGLVYLYFASQWLLPDRKPAISAIKDVREYTIEMIVEPGSPLAGKTVEDAGLRHLAGVYLVEIERGETRLQAVGPREILQANDRLIFVGVVDSVKDLKRIRGLAPATDQVFKIDAPRTVRCLVEAVVSNTCPLVNQSIREGRFRSVYDAAVIAVARNGERIKSKIGDIVLRAGDTLLLETHPSFVERMGNSRDFFLVSTVRDSAPVRHEKAWISMSILVLMVVAMSTQVVDVLVAAMVAAGLMIVTRCCTAAQARASVDWQLLLIIASSLGLASALEKTGAARSIAEFLISTAGTNPWVALATIYVVASLFTEVLANNAAAALVFPIAIATADNLDVNRMPFIIAIMIAASASFATPIGYQTNMMVYGPGGYHFFDYTRIGLPLNVLMGIITVVIAPFVWPF